MTTPNQIDQSEVKDIFREWGIERPDLYEYDDAIQNRKIKNPYITETDK